MPAFLRADWTVLLPRTLETHSWIDLYGVYESDRLTAPARNVSWSDLYFKEMLSLQTSGYFYHPRLVQYRLLLSGGLKQETYEQSALPPVGTQNKWAYEYDAHLYFLPEHPYNLELFAARYEPLFRQHFASPFDSISTRRGADFRYRTNPWYVHARAEEDGFESEGVTTTVRTLNLDGKYAREFGEGRKLSLGFTYVPSRLRDTNGFASDSTKASLTNSLESRRLRLDSNVAYDNIDQLGGASALTVGTRTLSWNEQFMAELPYRLHADLFWRYLDSSTTYSGASAPAAPALSSVNRGVEADLRHQLYQSLQTTYTFRWDENTSSGGETKALNNSLNLAYTKLVPDVKGWLSLGLYIGSGETQTDGAAQVVDEQHPNVAVPGPFLLGSPNVDPGTVVILVRSPQPPFDLVKLTEGVEYTLATVGNALEVTVFTLPAEFPLPGRYDFRATYSLLTGSFRVRTRGFGQNGSLTLFNNLLTPYYSYSQVSSETLSGTVPGGGFNSRVFTAGLSFFRGPLRARVEYGDVRWATSPWQGWKGEVQYTGPLGQATNVNGTAAYQIRHFEASQKSGALPAYTEKVAGASGNVQQYLLSRTLSLSAGGSYSWLTGLTDTRAYTLNATLSWKIGKLDLAGGATYSSTLTQGGTPFAGSTIHRFYFLKLRRMIF